MSNSSNICGATNKGGCVALDRLSERDSRGRTNATRNGRLTWHHQPGSNNGKSNKEVADQLSIAEKTVGIHVSSVLDKMGLAIGLRPPSMRCGAACCISNKVNSPANTAFQSADEMHAGLFIRLGNGHAAGLMTLAQPTTSIREFPGIHSRAMQARAGDLPGLK